MPSDNLATLGIRTSAGTVMTKSRVTNIYTGSEIESSDNITLYNLYWPWHQQSVIKSE